MAERPQIRKLVYLPQWGKWQWQRLITEYGSPRRWAWFGPPFKTKKEGFYWMNTKGDRQL